MSIEWGKFVRDRDRTVTVAPIRIDHCAGNYEDARSAAFFAMGLSVKRKEPVTILLPGMYLPSIYTALTEAWFQKAELVVLAFYHRVSEVNTAWADRCCRTMVMDITDFEEQKNEIQTLSHMHKPLLVNLIGVKEADLKEPETDYQDVMEAIRNADPAATITCYNSVDTEEQGKIESRYKYGALSRYIGMSVVAPAGYLLCTADCVLIDANIFRTRYANGNMKIVILDDGRLKKNRVDSWISSNGWKLRRIQKMDEDSAVWLRDQTCQAVLIIG